jgi:hypothetical protein
MRPLLFIIPSLHKRMALVMKRSSRVAVATRYVALFGLPFAGSSTSTPLASYYLTNRCTAVKPKDVTGTLRHAMRINFHRTGIQATDISARSLRAGSVMAMFFGKIDMNNIILMGRWHSDVMMRYLHGQAQPIVGRFAEVMYNGAYTFQPDETVPIIDSYDD